jgi:arsenate reductase
MSERTFSVLFVSTSNSARSIMAEAVLKRLGRGRFRAFSAGTHPTGVVDPLALEALSRMQFPTEGFRSKSWEEFAAPGAEPLDLVFTVCDKAAGEACPIWPGQPITAHWGVEDPAVFVGPEEKKLEVFRSTLVKLARRIELLLSLPLEKLERLALETRLGLER